MTGLDSATIGLETMLESKTVTWEPFPALGKIQSSAKAPRCRERDQRWR